MFSGVSERFFTIAASTPDRPAIATTERDVTYGELAESSLRVAAGLTAAGFTPGSTIAVRLPRDERLVAALFGAMAAGVAYVPIDPRHDSERTTQVIGLAGAELVLDADQYARLTSVPAAAQPRRNAAGDLAYIIFTSGSTGEPKGVQIEHGSIAALLDWADEAWSADEVAWGAAVTSVAFDVSVMDLLMPLSRGGAVVLADDVIALPRHRAFDRVTSIQLVPSAATVLLEDPLPASVRTVAFAGERLPRALCDKAWANPNVSRVLNMYGPTESTVLATWHEVPRHGQADPPIGRPLTGTGVLIRDEEGRDVPDGHTGELWLTGPQLARGYIGRPDLTERAFVDAGGTRAYRTGDVVRIVDGDIHCLGRRDDQVKIRGFRIELGEVESALRRLPGVRQAAAVADGDRLVGFVGGTGFDIADLRQRMRRMVPDHFVPDRFVVLADFPLTASGKTDRARLPLPGAVDGTPVADDLERSVAQCASTILETQIAVRDVPLDTLGMHSLAAARLIGRLTAETGRQLRPADLLGPVTVADIADRLRRAPAAPAPASPTTELKPGDIVRLDSSQRDTWVLRSIADDPAAASVGFRLRIEPAPDPEQLRLALIELTRIHPTLRMAVDATPDGPVGRILEPAVTFEVGTDLAGLDPVPLDGSGPTLRARWIPRDGGGDLALVVDHVALDGWGMGVLTDDLDRLLAGEQVDPPVFAPPAEPDDHHRTPPLSDDPLGLGAGTRSAPRRGRRIRVPDDHPSLTPSERLARLAILLHRLTGDRQVVVGVAAARRHHPGAERVVAPLMTVLRVGVEVEPELTVADVGERAARALAAAMHDVDLPTDGTAIPVLLSVQPDFPVRRRRVSFLGEIDTGGSQADLTVLVNRTADGPEVLVEHDLSVPGPTAEAFAQRFRLVCAIAPDSRVGEVDVRLPEEVIAQEAWSVGPDLRSAGDLVERIRAQDPSRTAVTDQTGAVRRFGDLVDTARSVGAALTAAGVAPGNTVGVCLARDADLPGRLLGVLLAGAAYVPIDPSHPRSRIDYVVGDAGCAVILVDPSGRSAVTADGSPVLIDVTTLPPADEAWAPVPADPELPAYVLHTSGSTGRPKGVTVLRRNLSWFCAAMTSVPGFTAADLALATTTLTFDIAGLEIWGLLAHGGRVHMVDRETASDGAQLAKAAEGATIIQATPSGWKMLLDAGWSGASDATLIAGGEVLPPDVAGRLHDRGRSVWNAYGPTEATIWATMHRVDDSGDGDGDGDGDGLGLGLGTGAVPIGRPLPGVTVRVATPDGNPVPIGHVGELWIGGPGVAAGYHGRPDLTAERFRDLDGQRWYRTGDVVRWLPSGVLEYLRRTDDQVKVRGHRIEPGEVEVVLRGHRAVADVAVGARGDVLVAWWVADGDVESAELTSYAREHLPAYLVPDQWVRLDVLPLGPNGKLDRGALPAPAPDRATDAGGPPQGPVEELVAQIWTKVLEVDAIGRDSSFFVLGGHSLAVTRVMAALRDELDLTLPAATLFEHPRLADFAERVTEALVAEATS